MIAPLPSVPFPLLPTADAPAEAKVRVHFKAVGAAPILKKNKFLIPSSEPFGTVRRADGPPTTSFVHSHFVFCVCLSPQVIKFLRTQLRLADGASLVCALCVPASALAPSCVCVCTCVFLRACRPSRLLAFPPPRHCSFCTVIPPFLPTLRIPCWMCMR